MLVKVRLSENPKAVMMKPFVARLIFDADPDKCLEFLRPITCTCGRNGILLNAEYDFDVGVPYIVRADWSSHRNKRYAYMLVVFDGQELKTLASIEFVNSSVSIAPDQLKLYYAQYRKPVAALWAFWRSLIGLNANESVATLPPSEG
jgi:hypothetical protein